MSDPLDLKDDDIVEDTSTEDVGSEDTSTPAGTHLGMSDEDFLKAAFPTTPDVVVEPKVEADQGDGDIDGDGEGSDDTDAGTTAKEAEAAEAAAAAGRARDAQGRFAGKEAKADEPKVDADAKPATEVTPAAPVIDYKAEYERLTKPFKANGKDIAVSNVDEAVQLMQMGANYNKKMAALKPNLQLLKLLENAGMLDAGKINFMIDAMGKTPNAGAISKLVKDSGLDPLDLDAEKAGAYKPTTRTVDDREIELDTVLDELKDSPTYTRTLGVVSNQWDAASKQRISENPQVLKAIDDHMARGVYDLITTEVDRQRVFGRLDGVSDIEAYQRVGDAMNAKGSFNHLYQDKLPVQGQPKTVVAEVVAPKPKVNDAALNAQRRAAGSTKPAPSTSKLPADFNPLSMSDEEFGKLGLDKYL